MTYISLSYGLFLTSVLSVANSFDLPFEGIFKLDIIHFSDFHARFEETSYSVPICRFNNNSCLGGFPRLYHEIQELRSQKPESIILNAGDSFQGTYWYTLLKWNITQKFMNLLPLDAHALGNHEFDDGPTGLAPYMAALKAPVLAANMDCSAEPILQDLYRPSIVLKRGGRRIGIIGLITPDTKIGSPVGNVIITDPGAATKKELQVLTEQGVDIIILLSHCGVEVDKQLARDYGEYIDIIIGSHSHGGLQGMSSTTEFSYPMLVKPTGDPTRTVVVVQSPAFTKSIGNLTVYFDFRGHYVKWDGGLVSLDRKIEEDQNIKAQLAPYAKLVHEAEKEVIGMAAVNLDMGYCDRGECALGNMIADAFNEKARASVKSNYSYLTFIQRGNIRSSLNIGNITIGNVYEVLPYLDQLQTFELQGKYVRKALERSVKDAWSMDPFRAPWLLQVSGIRVVYNVTLPEGQRLISASVGNTTLLDDLTYMVTAPEYIANGGDGYKMFKKKHNMVIIGRDAEMTEEYIKLHSPLHPVEDGRVKIYR